MKVQWQVIGDLSGRLEMSSIQRKFTGTLGPAVLLFLWPIVINGLGFSSFLSANPEFLLSGLYKGVHQPLLSGLPGWIDPNSGFSTQALGGLAARDWLAGLVPWWDHYVGTGLPLAASMQSQSLFVPFVFLLALSNGPLLYKVAMEVVAGIAMWALARKVGLHRITALTVALAFQINGTFAWFSDAPIGPIAFLPLFLLGVEWAVNPEEGGPRVRWLVMAPALALSLYAGFPEVAYIDGLLALAWACVRVAQLTASERGAAIARIVTGGVAGCLLAAPMIILILNLFSQVDTQSRADITSKGLNAQSGVLTLLPYFAGPISDFSKYGESASYVEMWSNIGGYLPLATVILAAFGVASRQNGPLRWLLGLWIVLSLSRNFSLFGTVKLFQSIPGDKFIAFFRYSWPSIEFSAALLAGLAIDELRDVRVRRSPQAIMATFIGVIAVIVCCIILWNDCIILTETKFSTIFLFTSVTFAIFSAGYVVYLFFSNESGRLSISTKLCLVWVFSAAVYYELPLFSGFQKMALDNSAIAFLHNNLRYQRFYTLGPFASNYSGLYKIASINTIYNPPPTLWVTQIVKKLDPCADAINFRGDWPSASTSCPLTRAGAVKERMAEFEAVGVKYVVTPPGSNPFQDDVLPQGSLRARLAVDVDHPYEDIMTLSQPSGAITSVSIGIGTYHGQADGKLELSLCARSVCSTASRAVSTIADNSNAVLTLEHPLEVDANVNLTVSVRQIGGSHPFALWTWSPSGSQDSGAPLVRAHAILRIGYSSHAEVKLVYTDQIMDVYELPKPASYFTVSDMQCQMTVGSRDALDVICPAASRLTRLETSDPGWRATNNGMQVPISTYDGRFQQLELPAGLNHIVFVYFPPHMELGVIGLAAGVVACFAGVWGGRFPLLLQVSRRSSVSNSTRDL